MPWISRWTTQPCAPRSSSRHTSIKASFETRRIPCTVWLVTTVRSPLAGGKFAYYAIGVYSQVLTRSRTNGIPAFDQSWKDIVATFYHELCESRTNPDIEEVNRTGNDSLLGWYADKHGEIGDLPMLLAGAQLQLVMKEVPLANGHGTVPIQLEWSNAVNGPEGPVAAPH